MDSDDFRNIFIGVLATLDATKCEHRVVELVTNVSKNCATKNVFEWIFQLALKKGFLNLEGALKFVHWLKFRCFGVLDSDTAGDLNRKLEKCAEEFDLRAAFRKIKKVFNRPIYHTLEVLESLDDDEEFAAPAQTESKIVAVSHSKHWKEMFLGILRSLDQVKIDATIFAISPTFTEEGGFNALFNTILDARFMDLDGALKLALWFRNVCYNYLVADDDDELEYRDEIARLNSTLTEYANKFDLDAALARIDDIYDSYMFKHLDVLDSDADEDEDDEDDDSSSSSNSDPDTEDMLSSDDSDGQPRSPESSDDEGEPLKPPPDFPAPVIPETKKHHKRR